jgi:hypothetical protein
MKKIAYLSPSSISLYEQDPEQFYLRYLSLDRPDLDPQTQPMSVGSAFDAYAKSYLYEKLFGKGSDPKFDFQNLFEAQVESCNRDWALKAGKYCFDFYQKTGALSDLLLDLQHAVNVPRFEIEIKGIINGYREGVTLDVSGVTLLGKPDIFYINQHGTHIILDWKVNAFCSKYPKTPTPGYVRLRGDSKKSGHHKDCNLMMLGGTLINGSQYLEDVDETWARQLSIYGWLSGCEVGQEFITAIDQLACSPSGIVDQPIIRVAEVRCRVNPDYQYKTFALAQKIWNLCHSEHFFRDLTLEESQARCAILDDMAKGMRGDGSDKDRWYQEMTRAR